MGCSRVVVCAKVDASWRAPDAQRSSDFSRVWRIARHIPHELEVAREKMGRLFAFMRGSIDAKTLQPESDLQRAGAELVDSAFWSPPNSTPSGKTER